MLAFPNPEMRSPATRQSDRANSQSSISSEKSNVPAIDFQAAKSLGEYALDYARRGWHVFPCKPSNKAPYIAGGLNRATTDPDVIAEWWGQWPHAMIGVRMGEESGPKFGRLYGAMSTNHWGRGWRACRGEMTTVGNA
ncbi:bifunctional DNA primase/polymerase [Bradyrhizobium lablabi]|uniref:bifunctional DNA primase/polymerase n=1 Tax=Bradyrhizobium lablabi TaxID=722472 RepID=UPI0018D2B73F|nr:bifunctional DNA primase/polymerase [Bradyrhizobium lablabi]